MLHLHCLVRCAAHLCKNKNNRMNISSTITLRDLALQIDHGCSDDYRSIGYISSFEGNRIVALNGSIDEQTNNAALIRLRDKYKLCEMGIIFETISNEDFIFLVSIINERIAYEKGGS